MSSWVPQQASNMLQKELVSFVFFVSDPPGSVCRARLQLQLPSGCRTGNVNGPQHQRSMSALDCQWEGRTQEEQSLRRKSAKASVKHLYLCLGFTPASPPQLLKTTGGGGGGDSRVRTAPSALDGWRMRVGGIKKGAVVFFYTAYRWSQSASWQEQFKEMKNTFSVWPNFASNKCCCLKNKREVKMTSVF